MGSVRSDLILPRDFAPGCLGSLRGWDYWSFVIDGLSFVRDAALCSDSCLFFENFGGYVCVLGRVGFADCLDRKSAAASASSGWLSEVRPSLKSKFGAPSLL